MIPTASANSPGTLSDPAPEAEFSKSLAILRQLLDLPRLRELLVAEECGNWGLDFNRVQDAILAGMKRRCI